MLDADLLPLDGDRARLRPLRHDDAPAFAEGTSDPAVQAYAHLPEPSYTPATVRAMIDGAADPGLQRGDLAVLAIAQPETDAFAGSLVVFDVSDDAAEVGFWVHPDHRGAGVAAAALDLAAGFARASGLERLTARTVADNTASQRVLSRAGFVETGRAEGTAPSGREVDLRHHERRV